MVKLIEKYNKQIIIFLLLLIVVILIGTIGMSRASDNSNIIYTRDELSELITEIQGNVTSDKMFLASYPVGSIFITANNTNPNSIGGTWIEFGTGKTLVGLDSTNTNFNTLEKTGGELIHTHTYGFQHGGWNYSTIMEQDSHSGIFNYDSSNNKTLVNTTGVGNFTTNINSALTYGSQSQTAAHYNAFANVSYTANLQPYITVKMWKRTL